MGGVTGSTAHGDRGSHAPTRRKNASPGASAPWHKVDPHAGGSGAPNKPRRAGQATEMLLRAELISEHLPQASLVVIGQAAQRGCCIAGEGRAVHDR